MIEISELNNSINLLTESICDATTVFNQFDVDKINTMRELLIKSLVYVENVHYEAEVLHDNNSYDSVQYDVMENTEQLINEIKKAIEV